MTRSPETPSHRPTEHQFTRRSLLGSAAVAGLALAGCGSSGGSDSAGAGTRSFRHALGTTEIPVRPSRVATLDELVVAHLASVGLLVVAANDDGVNWVQPYRRLLPADLDPSQITAVGGSEEPNFEALAGTRPELIVVGSYYEDFYPQLAQIAPTVAFDKPTNADWKPTFDLAVRAAGREQQGARVVQRYEETVRRVSAMQLPRSVSFVRSSGGGSFRIDGTGAFPGGVAAEAGIEVADGPPKAKPEEGSGFVELSGERMRAIDGDVIVTATYAGEPPQVQELRANPLWKSLPAVRAGRLVGLPGEIYNGGTYVAAQLLLERLVEPLGGGA